MAYIAVDLTPPGPASEAARVSPHQFLRSSPVQRAVKRKLDYPGTIDFSDLSFDLPLNPADKTVVAMQERHQNILGPHRKKIRLMLPQATFGQVVREVRELKEEVRATREELHATREELHATREELHATREELHATREEMRALQEDNSTHREELRLLLELKRRQDAQREPLFVANLLTDFIMKLMKEKREKGPKSRGPQEKNRKGKGKAKAAVEEQEAPEGSLRGHDNSRLAQYASSITRKMLEEMGLGKYEPIIRSVSQVIAARNRAAHETPTDFAQYLLELQHEDKLRKWRALFTWTYDNTVEAMAGQDTDECARLLAGWTPEDD